MRKTFRDHAIVITGASSGIGRATALAFARRGAALTLTARREEPLRELAAECERLGAPAMVVLADVTNEEAVLEVARRTVHAFGHLDVWVNNAAVTLFGLFEQTPPEAFRRVIETNLFGYVHGARAALPQFRRQGRGVLVNVASMVARVAEPYTTAYSASKHAIRGLGQALRQELLLLGEKGVHVCTVLPASIDTPIFQHAANYSGREVVAMPPVYPAARVACAIVRVAARPEREVYVGGSARAFAFLEKVAPALAERRMATTADKKQLSRDVPAPATNGNLFAPTNGAEISGGWQARRTVRLLRSALIGLAVLAPLTLGALLVAPRLPALRG
jgi:short-subunit dehydrogenase